MLNRSLRKTILIIFTLTLLMPLLSSNTEAASGSQGYAIYRDGVFNNYQWHAGIMDTPYRSWALPVIHIPGYGDVVKWASWSEFMNGKVFKGVYRPKVTPSSSQRDLFVSMGRKLRTENIGYGVTYQVNYSVSGSGTWVDASEIVAMRCDGVVEYIYEWYGFRVYGSNSYWDVTKSSSMNKDHHSGTKISPKTQWTYLTLVRSSAP